MKDGLEKLRGIWIGAVKSNVLNGKDNEKRMNAMVITVSAMHLWPMLKEKEVTLASLWKMMVEVICDA